MDLQAAYRSIREGLRRDLEGLGPEAETTRVPATPDWTVKDVVAHVAGILADAKAGNLEGAGTDAWTAKQVDDRRDCSLAEVLDEWDALGAELEPAMPDFPEEAVASLIGDAFTHEQDVRGAVGAPGNRDSDAFHVAYDFYVDQLDGRLQEADLALRLRAGAEERVLGEGEAAATLSAPPFEVLRGITGRRSADQVRAWDWEGDVDAVLEHLPNYPMRAEPLEE